MFVKGDTLYVLGNSLPKKKSKSILLLLNAKTGASINSFSPKDISFKYLNDLAVASNGDVDNLDRESGKIIDEKKLETYQLMKSRINE